MPDQARAYDFLGCWRVGDRLRLAAKKAIALFSMGRAIAAALKFFVLGTIASPMQKFTKKRTTFRCVAEEGDRTSNRLPNSSKNIKIEAS
jgi:hypothetical protein